MRRITLAALLMGLAACPAHACDVAIEHCTAQQVIQDQQSQIEQLTWQSDRQREEISNLRAEEMWDATPTLNAPRDDE